MQEFIYVNLTITYQIIKYIQHLYLKYNKIIKFKSFEPCGKSIDTIYRVLQIKALTPPILMSKVKIINNSIYLLPLRIITTVGIWTFVSEPTYIEYDMSFTMELYTKLNLKYILPYTYSETYGLLEPMFMICNFDKNKFNNDYYKINYINLNTISKIYNFDDMYKNIINLFNDFTYGPDVIDYIFNNLIDRLILTNSIDDKKQYFTNYKKTKNKKEYVNKIKNLYLYKKKYYNKRDLSTLFYYNYCD